MATTSPKTDLEKLLSGSVGRDNFQELVEQIYASYATVDLAHNRIRQMEEKLEKSSGEEERDLTEKLGILHFAMGEYQAAAEKLEQVSRRKNASHFLGRAYLQLGREPDALEQLDKGRQGDQDLQTDICRIEALCRLREEERAREVLDAYSDVEDETPDLHYARGRVAEAWGEYGEAMDCYEAALEQDAEHARSLFRLALNCDLNGEDERAIELYERCVNLRPTYVGALMNLGVLYEDHGRYADAIRCYQRVLAIDPHHQQAQLFLKDAESSLNMVVDLGKSRRAKQLEEVFGLPVNEFELSARSRRALEHLDISTLGALTQVTRGDLLDEKNFGDKSVEEIEDLLARYNLELGEQIEAEAPEAEEEEEIQQNLDIPVEGLEFSTRVRKCLERLQIKTVGELIAHTEKELLTCPNFGSTSLDEVVSKLAELGLSLKSE